MQYPFEKAVQQEKRKTNLSSDNLSKNTITKNMEEDMGRPITR